MNSGCNGGNTYRAFDWLMAIGGGIATDQSYGKYLQADGVCHFRNATMGAQLAGYYFLKLNDTRLMKWTLANVGPVVVALHVPGPSFFFYDNGVYSDVKCRSSHKDLNHELLLGNISTHNSFMRSFLLLLHLFWLSESNRIFSRL